RGERILLVIGSPPGESISKTSRVTVGAVTALFRRQVQGDLLAAQRHPEPFGDKESRGAGGHSPGRGFVDIGSRFAQSEMFPEAVPEREPQGQPGDSENDECPSRGAAFQQSLRVADRKQASGQQISAVRDQTESRKEGGQPGARPATPPQ